MGRDACGPKAAVWESCLLYPATPGSLGPVPTRAPHTAPGVEVFCLFFYSWKNTANVFNFYF